MMIRVTLDVEVDMQLWAETHGMTDSSRRGYSVTTVKNDVRTAITNLVIGSHLIEEVGATINGISPDSIRLQAPPALLISRGRYIKVEKDRRTDVEIDDQATSRHGSSDDVLITTEADVFRYQRGAFIQTCGECEHCGKPEGREVVNQYAHQIYDVDETMISCPACAEIMRQDI
jgi:hypothetical protein